MAVIAISDGFNLPEEAYAGMVAQLSEEIRSAPGFILHAGGPGHGGWSVIEVWESQEDADRWFNDTVKPNLPPGVDPPREIRQLHTVVRK